MKFFIVDSVKGGCGKTALAIHKALELASKNAENKVCIIDMDLLGTSIEAFLGISYCSSLNPKVHYLSDMFLTRSSIKTENYVRNLIFSENDRSIVEGENFDKKDMQETTQDINGQKLLKIGAVFSSPLEVDKRLFKPNIATHYVHHVDYNFFARKIEMLFERLEGYTHIVIDMPPNSDPYTDSIFDLLLRRNRNNIEYVELLLISTWDRSHCAANFEWLNDKLQGADQNWHLFDQITLVFNDNRNVLVEQGDLESAQDQVNGMLGEYPAITSFKNFQLMNVKYNPELSRFPIFDVKTDAILNLRSGTQIPVKTGLNIRLAMEKFKLTV